MLKELIQYVWLGTFAFVVLFTNMFFPQMFCILGQGIE